MTPGLIDRIYECAFAPELWPGVFDELAEIADARGGFLFTANKQVLNWTASASLCGGMERFVRGNYYSLSQRVGRLVATRQAAFMRESDLYTDAELAGDPLYRDLLWPAALGWAAGTMITSPTGDMLFLSVERDRARGPVEPEAVERLNALRPHLARSASMTPERHDMLLGFVGAL